MPRRQRTKPLAERCDHLDMGYVELLFSGGELAQLPVESS